MLTPYKDIGFFYDIDRDITNSTFKKLSFHYSVGLHKIYTAEQIEKENSQPYFITEFELAYSTGTGDDFIEQSIQATEDRKAI